MGKLRWYKRDPVAALEGMSNLSLEEVGAYNIVLDLIYARDGAVDDDPRFIAGWLRCDVRVWKRIRDKLLTLEKLYVQDGQLRNLRADAEVLRGLSMVASASEAGKASARKQATDKSKNNDIASTTDATTVSTNSTTTTTEEERKKESSLRSGVVSRETQYEFESGVIRLTRKDFEKWREAFSFLDLRAELMSLSDWAQRQPKWFPAVSGALAKRNRDEKRRREPHIRDPVDVSDPAWREAHKLDGIL